MPKRRLPFILRECSRHGRLSWYFRRGKGQRIRLPDEYGSSEFPAAYNAALQVSTQARGHLDAPQGTLLWLISQWKASSNWERRSKATKRQRDNILRRVVDTAGRVSMSEITKRHVLQGMEGRRDTPFAANNFLKTMRALFGWACEYELVSFNPTTGVKMFPKATDGFAAWTDQDAAHFRERWQVGTRERLAMEILLYTGLRRGDAVRFGRQHVKDNYISMVMEKTSVKVEIPMSEHLKSLIDRSPVDDMTFIMNLAGLPMSKEGFGNWFGQSCRVANVSASAHGLRKLAAVKLAEAGATESEISAWFGWKSNRQSEVYTRTANRRKLTANAIRRIER